MGRPDNRKGVGQASHVTPFFNGQTKKRGLTMSISKTRCPCGKKLIVPKIIQVYRRWEDPKVRDEDLSSVDIIYRVNDEHYIDYQCPVCGLTWEEL